MKRRMAALLAACACLLGGHAYAHHSFPGTYLEDRTITIQGELVQILFRNPHSFVQLMVKENDGSVVRYAVEWVGASELSRQGVTAATLKTGDYVVISGVPGRNPTDHRVRMVSLRRPKDGFGWKIPPDRMMNN
ncbi:MAG TPA: DUF6152 family protein [Vicinamibacterales bacterium]